MTTETLMKISIIFCGNEGEWFKYKTGPNLVQFFNTYFGYKDVYKNPFPSRHIYTNNKLIELYNKNKIEDFFNVILNKRYIMKEFEIVENEAATKIDFIHSKINTILNIDGFTLQLKNKKYYIIKEDDDLLPIGSGGFADVFEQKSTGLVIKKLRDDYWRDTGIVHRFKREFKISEELNALSFIIKVYEYNSNNYSYSMEKAELTLEEYIEKNIFNDDSKIIMIRQILSAMQTVHEKNIIHRDISPNNIFIISGMLKIADFGLGKDLNSFSSHQTMYTNSFGQFLYCAPEQFMLLREGDKRSDVFSLGRLINFIMTKDPRNDNHIFKTVVNKATNSNSIYRYENAGELLDKLNKTIEYNKDTSRFENCHRNLSNGLFDDSIEQFLCELSDDTIVKLLLEKNSKLNLALLKFMKCSNENSEYLIHSIENSYRDVCSSYESYDGISTFAGLVINENYNFITKESACRILNYIAKQVGRFHAQWLIENILQKGIEPLLEVELNA